MAIRFLFTTQTIRLSTDNAYQEYPSYFHLFTASGRLKALSNDKIFLMIGPDTIFIVSYESNMRQSGWIVVNHVKNRIIPPDSTRHGFLLCRVKVHPIYVSLLANPSKGLFRLDATTSNRRRLYCIKFLMRRGRCECSDWPTCVPKPAPNWRIPTNATQNKAIKSDKTELSQPV